MNHAITTLPKWAQNLIETNESEICRLNSENKKLKQINEILQNQEWSPTFEFIGNDLEKINEELTKDLNTSQIEVSIYNKDRLESNPNFDSINETLSHVIDVYEDVWNCILSGEPKTEELKKLNDKWGTFEYSEFKELENNICLLFAGNDKSMESELCNAIQRALEVFIEEHFKQEKEKK